MKNNMKMGLGWIILIPAILLFICWLIISVPIFLVLVVIAALIRMGKATWKFITESFDMALTSLFEVSARIVVNYKLRKEKYHGNPEETDPS
jgi:hypothetical protein